MKKMEISDFYSEGYLQELNRLFLHPLGLAMVVEEDEEGNIFFNGIEDNRDDPEGFLYGEDILDLEVVEEIKANMKARAFYRRKIPCCNINGVQYK